MIRYPATLEELRARIEQDVPGWGARAKRRTEKFRCTKKYDEKSSIWSEVKGDAAARAFAKSLLASSAPHANCGRSFARLFRDDRVEADAVAVEVVKFLLSGSL